MLAKEKKEKRDNKKQKMEFATFLPGVTEKGILAEGLSKKVTNLCLAFRHLLKKILRCVLKKSGSKNNLCI